MTPQPPDPPAHRPPRPPPVARGPSPGASPAPASPPALPFVAPPPVLKVGAAAGGSATKVDIAKPEFPAPSPTAATERHDPRTLALWHAHYLAEGYDKEALVAQAQSLFADDEPAFHEYWYAFHEAIATSQPAAHDASVAAVGVPLGGVPSPSAPHPAFASAPPIDDRVATPQSPPSSGGALGDQGDAAYAAPSDPAVAWTGGWTEQGAAVYLRVRTIPMDTQTTPMGWALFGAVALAVILGVAVMAFASDRLLPDLPTYVPAQYLGTPEEESYRAARDQLLEYGGAWAAYRAEYEQEPETIEQLQHFRRELPRRDPWKTGYALQGRFVISAGPDAQITTDDDLYTVGDSGVIGSGPAYAGYFDFASMVRAAEGNAKRVRELQARMFEEQVRHAEDFLGGTEPGGSFDDGESGADPRARAIGDSLPSEAFAGRESDE